MADELVRVWVSQEEEWPVYTMSPGIAFSNASMSEEDFDFITKAGLYAQKAQDILKNVYANREV